VVQPPGALELADHGAGDVHVPRVRLGGAADAVEARLQRLGDRAKEGACSCGNIYVM
jgi:hypothetical protein